jgi:hypothetical protein
MKYVDEYRDYGVAQKLTASEFDASDQAIGLMEICGGQTHSIEVWPGLPTAEVELVHGPGCPVCVTSLEMIDKAHRIAERPDVICSFGDMLRVPGSDVDLLIVKSRGADIRVVYSPLDCLKIAKANPTRKVGVLRHRLQRRLRRPMLWRRGRPGRKAFTIFRFLFRTCSFRGHELDPAVAAESGSGIPWAPDTFVPSWVRGL